MAAILGHPNTPPGTLVCAMKSFVPEWVRGVARNTGLPLRLAAELLCAGSAEVRCLLIRNVGVPVSPLTDHDWSKERSVDVILAAIPRLDGAVREVALARLLMRSRTSVSNWQMVAALTRDPEMVSRLCWDSHPGVRAHAQGNPLATDADRVAAALLDRSP